MRGKLFINSIFIVIHLLIFNIAVNSYNVETPEHVHQYLTNESQSVWKLMPHEIKQRLNTPLNQNLDSNFDPRDDIITGSGEEDALVRWVEHFWQPDDPSPVYYNFPLNHSYLTGISGFESSYNLAKNLFIDKVVKFYLRGDINESYYWLGRVAHLLEDAAVPAHMHLDFDSLEKLEANNEKID